MTPAQIQHVRGLGKKLAAIITTRNATFWLVDQAGRAVGEPNSDARFEVVAWDDANELVTLRPTGQIRNDQFQTLQYLSYGPIDELLLVE